MLHDFLTRERKTILDAARQKALDARWGRISSEKVEEGWEFFYDELTGLFKGDTEDAVEGAVRGDLTDIATRQDRAYLRLGYAITEAVQSYNIIYQAITESATAQGFDISPDEYQQLTFSLDTAISDVVSDFEKAQTEAQDSKETERLGFLAHELRNCLQSATISLEMIETGNVGITSKTGGLLRINLQRMAELIDKALTGVRLRIEPAVVFEQIRALDIMSEVEVTAGFQARARDITLRLQGFSGLMISVDRQLFVSALSNLVQNALKFSHAGSTVQIRARQDGDRVLIEVEDACGGLPDGSIAELFEPGVQAGADRTGVGLGLAISRQAVEKNNGTLRVQDLPGKGCIFIIDLPKV